MKPKSFSALAAASLACIAIFSLSVLVSFTNKEKPKPPSKKTCDITCTWYAGLPGGSSKKGLAAEGMDWCNVDSHGALNSGTWTGTISNATSCPYQVGITTVMSSVHAAGTIDIYQNGSLVTSHSVSANQNVAFDDFFTGSCGDHFDVYWY